MRIQKRIPLLVCVLAGVAAVVPACQSGPAEPIQASAPPPSREEVAAVGTLLGAYRLSVPARSESEAAARAGTVARVLTHQNLEATSVAPLAVALRRTPLAASARLADHPHVAVGHHPRGDAVWAIDEDVAHDVTSEVDVGVDAATVEFHRIIGELEQAQIADGAVLDVAGAHVGHVMQGSGWSNGPQKAERIKEYVFSAPRRINGIEIANAGVRVSVHRSGKVASIRVEGPVVDELRDSSGVSMPSGEGYFITRSVSETELDARVHAENPDATIKPMGTIYWLPKGHASATVEPRQAYWVFPRVEIAGHVGAGRGHRVLYAINDAHAAPLVAPVPQPGAPGDEGKGQ